jgi:hypothetical protein
MGGMNSPTAAGTEAPGTSFLDRLMGIFIEPGRVLEEVAHKPDFIKPLILLIAANILVTETMLAKIGMERLARNSLATSGRVANLSPEQMQQAIEKGAAIAGIIAHTSSFLGPPIFLALAAAVGLIALNGLFDVHVGFKKVFSLACYADLPGVLRGVMSVAVIYFGDPNAFNPQTPSPSNLGFFLDPAQTSHTLLALAASLDIFVVWFLILLSMGLSRAAEGKVKSRSIFLVYFGVWMILVLARVGFAMLA